MHILSAVNSLNSMRNGKELGSTDICLSPAPKPPSKQCWCCSHLLVYLNRERTFTQFGNKEKERKKGVAVEVQDSSMKVKIPADSYT